jgi:hypothetical protein
MINATQNVINSPRYFPANDFPPLIALTEINFTQLSSCVKRG